MTNKPDKLFEITRADEVAECWEGVSDALYRALWNKVVPAMKPLNNIEDSGPFDHVGVESLASHWALLSEDEQAELNRLAAKQREEYERWERQRKEKYS